MTPEQQWLEIQVRLVAGEATETPFQGVVEVVDHDAEETVRYVVRKDRHRWRVETEDGSPLSIQGDEHRFTFGEDSTTPGRTDRRDPDQVRDEATSVVARPRPHDRFPGDFTEPASAPERVTHLGRDAWRVSLLPPPHKEVVLVEVYDAATGMLLESGTERFGPNLRWLEIEPVDGFPDDTFAWDGGFAFAYMGDDVPDDLREMHEAERERERRAHEALGPADVIAAVPLALDYVYVQPDTSHLHGCLEGRVFVHFERGDALDLDERTDLSWQDDAGRSWSLSGRGATPELLTQVREWLERRAPHLDEL